MRIVGIDIGGTKIEAARFGDGFSLEARHRVPTEAHKSSEEIVQNVLACARAVWSDGVSGVGVGFPGFVRDGSVVFAPNLAALLGVPLPARIADAFGVPVRFANDANCFAVAEHRFGAGRGCSHMVGIVIGTGVGSGIVIGGRLYEGASGSAGELGQVPLPGGTRWEDHIAGPDIVRAYMEAGGVIERPSPSKIWSSEEEAAARTRERIVAQTGRFLAGVINALNPEAVVLGGGISNLPYLDAVRAACEPHCVAGAFAACRIDRYAVAEAGGALGAALLLEEGERERKEGP